MAVVYLPFIFGDRSSNACELSPYFSSRFARQFNYDQLYEDNPYRTLVHKHSLMDGVRTWRYFIMASTGVTFPMPTRDPPLLTTLVFCQWYNKINTIKSEYNIYYTRLVRIQRHYAEFAVKSNTSKIVGLKEYLKNLPKFRQSEGKVSSSKDKEHDEELKDKTAPAMVQFVREDEGDALKRDSDDVPSACLTLLKGRQG